MAFKAISHLVYRKIAFRSKVQALLDISELSLNKLEKSLVKKVLKNGALADSLDQSHL